MFIYVPIVWTLNPQGRQLMFYGPPNDLYVRHIKVLWLVFTSFMRLKISTLNML